MPKVFLTPLLIAGLLFLPSIAQAQPCSNIDINYFINDAKNLKSASQRSNKNWVLEGNQNNIFSIYFKRPANTLSTGNPNPDFEAQDLQWRSELFSLWKKWEKETKNKKIKNILSMWKKPSDEPYQYYKILPMIMRNQKC